MEIAILSLSLLLGFIILILAKRKKWIGNKKEIYELEECEKQLRDKIREEGLRQQRLEEENRQLETERVKLLTEVALRKQGVSDSLAQEDQISNRITEKQRELTKIIEEGSVIAKENIDKYAEEYRANVMKQAADEHAQVVATYRATETEILAKLEPVKAELAEYEAKRKAIIDAQKREQELKDQLDFHRIILTADAVEDIQYINSILGHLKKKDVVAKVVWESYLSGPTKEMLNRVVGKDKKCGIYRIMNIETSECYIGQGVDVAKRLAEHVKGTLGIQSIADQHIHHVMADKGIEHWTFELLEECEKEALNSREKYYIAYYRSNEFGYNRTQVG